MKPFFFLLPLIMLCIPNKSVQFLKQAERLLDTRPDSSIALINSIAPHSLVSNKLKAKKALLLSAALDKNYIDVKSDSLITIAKNYYSRHGNERDQMLMWYYDGIVRKNNNEFTQAVTSFEKAATKAHELKDTHYSGLIYRNIATCFSLSNNNLSAVDYMKQAVECFSHNQNDSLYLQYAKCSLAITYFNNKDYDEASEVLRGLSNINNLKLRYIVTSLEARIAIRVNGRYEQGTMLYHNIPSSSLSYHDNTALALAYEYLNKKDSSDIWINHAYSMAKDEADSATIDYTVSKILLHRGHLDTAFKLMDHSTHIQDSLTRALLNESVSSAQRDYFREESLKQKDRLIETRRRGVLLGLIGILLSSLGISLLVLESKKKDHALKELMAIQAMNGQSIIQLSKDNAELMSTHYSERIRHLDTIAKEYYLSDDKTKKNIVFNHFKRYVGDIDKDESFYLTLEKDLNRYCYGVMEKIRTEVPEINGRRLKLIALFFAGLSYETIAVITHAQSISSLKMQRSRFRKTISESEASDKELLLQMLEMKKQQARKTND